MPITPQRLPFFDHIAELRRRIVVIAVTVLVLSMALYTWGWQIYDFVLAPVLPLLEVKPQVFTPFGTFGLRFQVAFYAALVVGFPDHHLADHGVLPPGAQGEGAALRPADHQHGHRRCSSPAWPSATRSFWRPAFTWIFAQAGTIHRCDPGRTEVLPRRHHAAARLRDRIRTADRRLLPRHLQHRSVREAASSVARRVRRPDACRIRRDA